MRYMVNVVSCTGVVDKLFVFTKVTFVIEWLKKTKKT